MKRVSNRPASRPTPSIRAASSFSSLQRFSAMRRIFSRAVLWLSPVRPFVRPTRTTRAWRLALRLSNVNSTPSTTTTRARMCTNSSTDVPTFLRVAGKPGAGNSRSRATCGSGTTTRTRISNIPGAGNQQQTSRYLYRLRLNLDYTFNDRWFAAVGVTTNGAADSGNQQITEGFDDYGIYLHEFMLGWKPAEFPDAGDRQGFRAVLQQQRWPRELEQHQPHRVDRDVQL